MLGICFIKDSEHTYLTIVKRGDRATLKIKELDKSLGIPHDLAHFMVESEYKLEPVRFPDQFYIPDIRFLFWTTNHGATK